VSILLALVTSYEGALTPNLLSLGFCLPSSRLSFAIDCASRVSFKQFCALTALEYMLMDLSSFAIWNRKKAIVAFAATVWITNVLLLLQGEFPLCIRHGEPQ
jgi:hypothetical protein